MNEPAANIDPNEIAKFDSVASRWWDPESEFKPLHDINPLRLEFIAQQAGGSLKGLKVLDVGCGGGLLAEAMARQGAEVLGIDLSPVALNTAELHALECGVELQYRKIAVEDLAGEMPGQFDVITCMEMLEHVPYPASIIASIARLGKPGALVALSTIHRTPMSYLQAILGAEYLLQMLPKGTHDYRKFIRPSELMRWCRAEGMSLLELTGLHYNPLTKHYWLDKPVVANYLAALRLGAPAG